MDGMLKFVNCKVGGTQNQIFFYFFCENTSLCIYLKPEGMAQFDILHTFVENSGLLFFWAPLKAAKIWNSSKNDHI